jgi:cytolysin-activating lysine-acyltransferase
LIEGVDAPSLEPSALRGQPVERVAVEGPPPEAAVLRILSGVEFLSGHSQLHASYPPGMLARRIAPSLEQGQFRYYVDPRGVPLAFCNWAWLDAEVLSETLATGRDLGPAEFNCGGLPFFYEFLAPFGHCRPVVRDLRGLPFFEGRRVPAIRGEVRRGGRLAPDVHYFQF